MSDKLKSAYELAMEKLRRKDREAPRDSSVPEKLTPGQKSKIAEIRREVQAKLAEREILFKSEQRGAGGDYDKLKVIEEAYRRDRERILSRQEERIKEAWRSEGPVA